MRRENVNFFFIQSFFNKNSQFTPKIVVVEHRDHFFRIPRVIFDQNTVNLRFSGNQGTEHFFPLLPKSAIATWPFHEKHVEPRDKATVIAKVI